MDRRSFLKLLLSTPIAAQLDVEKLLWIPEKTIFIPSGRVLRDYAYFYGGARGGGKTLYRVPYHGIDISTVLWDKLEKR